ncbi:methyltransferase domain-containing protein [Anaeromyxobacter paludicola]|uniref:Phospholipase/carboxylesterase/thioesterase domain-containing protein n=1 Tax=Anaeromyxobacter paludicola TaxID=2918171 RepID=A0ABM7XFZ4_9BACT|nr:methyltransferase domain-containing protein [Anaeromyxobacter paludicola]BDG10744.1 hypothetical protein AMPC_38570 [Anaeromyxobacter paludicola]
MVLVHRSIPPRVPSERPPLLVLLHGIGADEEDLLPLVPSLDPRFHVVSVRAPHLAEPMGYRWWAIDWSAAPPRADPAEIVASRELLARFLEEAAAAYGTDPARTQLFGFSQGAILSLALLLARPDPARGVVAHSGRLARLPGPEPSVEALSRARALLLHGTEDDVVPVELGRKAGEVLAPLLGTRLEHRELAGLGHGISPESLALAARWLTARLDEEAAGAPAAAAGADHDRALSAAFDDQAARFERAPVQSDPAALARLVAFAGLPPGARLLDAGCGPGLVAEAFLEAGYAVEGVDLSADMVARARARCARFGARASFSQGSLFGLAAGPFDAAVSRFVLHHVEDPLAFLRRQAALLRPGGVLVACDHSGDPDPAAAAWHQEIERARDRTHTRNLPPGELVDLLARAGLEALSLREEPFALDFDEWFDRGSPDRPKAAVRARLLEGRSRSFAPAPQPGGGIRIDSLRVLVRGVKPG